MKKCSRSTARSTTWSKVAATALACWVAASRVESCGAGGACAGGVCVGGVCAGAVCAGEVCAGEVGAGEVCAGEVSAGSVWEYTSVAPQQTRESARSANGERNIFVCFISSMTPDPGWALIRDVDDGVEIGGVADSEGG